MENFIKETAELFARGMEALERGDRDRGRAGIFLAVRRAGLTDYEDSDATEFAKDRLDNDDGAVDRVLAYVLEDEGGESGAPAAAA